MIMKNKDSFLEDELSLEIAYAALDIAKKSVDRITNPPPVLEK
jgi:hypothetical protein